MRNRTWRGFTFSPRKPRRVNAVLMVILLALVSDRALAVERIDPGIFGVMVSGPRAAGEKAVEAALDLHARWVRVNTDFDKVNPDFRKHLEKGINVVVCVSNHDSKNALEGAYGSPHEWPNSGFPYKDKAVYQKAIRGILHEALPYLKEGRQLWIQCENEIGDAAANPKSRFWRGTMDDYRNQLKTFSETVREFNTNNGVMVKVVLSSLTSEGLDLLVAHEDAGRGHKERGRQKYVRKMIESMRDMTDDYDAVDLHLYGDARDIPRKVQAVRESLSKNHPFIWISTECSGPDYRSSDTPVRWDKDQDGFEKLQAEQVSERFRLAAENGASICLWFSLFDLSGETDVFKHLGLIDPTGGLLGKKPAYRAFQMFMEELQSKLKDQ